MSLPTEPVTLSVEQINELIQKLSMMRHDVNNKLSLIVASVELMRRRPEQADRLLGPLNEQPAVIAQLIAQFSAEMETALHVKRP